MLVFMTPEENVQFIFSVNECGEEDIVDGKMTFSGLVS